MARAPILVLDDGELDDVGDLLSRLGEAYVRLRGGAIPERVEPPLRLLVATARHAARIPAPAPGSLDPQPVRMAVVEEDSPTLRQRLRELDYDWLVRRPVHPQALRLMLLRALYEGRERRGEERVPVGTPVLLRAGLRRREALLLELSEGGGRLLAPPPLTPGGRITIHVPAEAAGGRSLALRARVVRADRAEGAGSEGRLAVGVRFERLSPGAQERLRGMLRARDAEPARLAPLADVTLGEMLTEAAAEVEARTSPPAPRPPAAAAPEASRSEAPAPPPEPAAAEEAAPAAPAEAQAPGAGGAAQDAPLEPSFSGADRRKHERRAYRATVRGVADEAKLALVGRDLSAGGMRIAPHPGLRPGDRLLLHLYGEDAFEPLAVRGEVLRDGGAAGLAIRFEPLDTEARARIERLVASLPAVESLFGDEADALGTIVSRIVERHGAEEDEDENPGSASA